MNLLHHGHEAKHRLALQAVHKLQNLRHADAALDGIKQCQSSEHLHIKIPFIRIQRDPGHFIIRQRNFVIGPELHNILAPERRRKIIVRSVPIHGLHGAHLRLLLLRSQYALPTNRLSVPDRPVQLPASLASYTEQLMHSSTESMFVRV
ncbi:hypothetical protein D3C73_1212150 [compost metagenome]